jgi:protein O-GlcNAc transferase
MKKVISFSLWGSNPTYNIGAIRNAEIAKELYPDFECWFYIHKETVPENTIETLSKLDNTKIILKIGDLSVCKPMMWRFESIDEPDVEVNMSRDTDTRILLREKLAVDEWLKSDKLFHIMRDHPYHNAVILGGMFGTKKIKNIPNWKDLMYNYIQVGNKCYDQNFLHDFVYNNVKDISLIHASFHKIEGNSCINFPIPYDNDFKFVGEYVYHNESRCQEHIDMLKNS